MKALIIEDDENIVEAVSLAFQIRWPEAKLVYTHLGEKGVELVESEAPDVVILDLGLPDINGFEVLKRVRLFSFVPIIILTVMAGEADIVKGLELGADDYMAKPFSQLELLARVQALVRRQAPPGEQPPLVCGSLSFDPSTRQLRYGEREISLTATEGQILNHLMRNAGHVVTHLSLIDEAWGEDYPGAADGLKVYIRRLRKKMETDPGQPKLILTKTGIGYLLAKPD